MKFTSFHPGAHRCFRDSGVQALRAAAKPTGSRERNSDKGKINLLAISSFEDLSQHLIALGYGFSCWLFKIKFVKYNLPNLICSILIRVLPCKIYYHYKTVIKGLKLRKIEQSPPSQTCREAERHNGERSLTYLISKPTCQVPKYLSIHLLPSQALLRVSQQSFSSP